MFRLSSPRKATANSLITRTLKNAQIDLEVTDKYLEELTASIHLLQLHQLMGYNIIMNSLHTCIYLILFQLNNVPQCYSILVLVKNSKAKGDSKA